MVPAIKGDRMTYAYGSRLQPVQFNLARLYAQEVTDLPRLLACKAASDDHKAAAIAAQPQLIARAAGTLASAIEYELDRYGCILLAVNPYYQPQIYGARAQRVAA